jgi:hypothetical protein
MVEGPGFNKLKASSFKLDNGSWARFNLKLKKKKRKKLQAPSVKLDNACRII